MDDYLKYTNGKEILYTGKVDSVKIHSGDTRVVFTGLLISDPKITKVKIYWNSRADSLITDISRSAGIDTLKIPIPLPEGTYNFEIFTFDGEGNSSIAVNTSGISYGDEYKQSLYNRVIKKVEKVGDNVIIVWYNGEETSPFTQIDYADMLDNEHVIRVATTEDTTVLENFKSMTRFKMQTYFLPDEFAVDTFKSDIVLVGVNEDITNLYIKNSGNPFKRSDNGTGKWGLPQDWLYTPNIINQNSGTAGGWSTDGNPSGVIHFESKDWGGEGVTNGKLYQTFELPAGSYTLEYYSDGGGSSDFQGNFVVAEGSVLPDIDNLNQVLAKYHWDQGGMGGTHKIAFTLDIATTVSIGWVVSFGSYTWCHINSVKMMSLTE
jgi:hypothetical protein